MSTIIAPQTWGTIEYYRVINNQDCLFNKHENYQKRSFRNRFYILTANGAKSLSIPLKKGKNKQLSIIDVEIAYHDNWEKNHLNAIKSAYGKSPFFEHYFPLILEVYKQKHALLFDFNLKTFNVVNEILNLNKAENYTQFYQPNTKIDFKKPANPYPQVFEYKYGFVPIPSILDLIFCCGPEAILYL